MRVVYRSPFVSTGRQRQWHPCFDSKLLLPPTLHRSSRYRRYTLLWLPRHRSVPSSVFSHRRNNVQSSISRIAGARPANSAEPATPFRPVVPPAPTVHPDQPTLLLLARHAPLLVLPAGLPLFASCLPYGGPKTSSENARIVRPWNI